MALSSQFMHPTIITTITAITAITAIIPSPFLNTALIILVPKISLRR